MKNMKSRASHYTCPGIGGCFPFAELRYATYKEKVLTIIGIISAIGAGFCVPILMILFGKMNNAFILHGIQIAYNNSEATSNSEDVIGFRWIKRKNTEEESIKVLTREAHEFAIGMAVVGTLQFLFGALFVVSLNYAAQQQIYRVRIAYFRAILHHDLAWFEMRSKREISHDIITNVTNLYNGLGERLGTLVYASVASVTCMTVAVFYGWKLALITLIVFPVLVTLYLLAGKLGKCLSVQEGRAYMSAELTAEDALINIRSVKAYHGEKLEIARYSSKLEASELASVRVGTFHGIISGLLWFTMYCSYALAFYYGVILTVEEEDYTPSVLIVVFFCVQIGTVSFLQLPRFMNVMNKARGSAREIFSVIDFGSVDDEESQNSFILNEPNSLTFHNVEFSYPSKPNEKVLKLINFSVTEGQLAVLVGNSGCGKSTCLKLIHRFYNAQSGSVNINGKDACNINLNWLRNKIGFVQQKTVLFGETILTAIVHGLPKFLLSDVVSATKAVNAHDAIMKMARQYDSILHHGVGEDMRQRLAIARVLLHRPSILILDEATSHLSSFEEVKLLRSLRTYLDHKTVIVVTSRMATMKLADKIIHIKNGAVIEEGTFQELLNLKGEFYSTIKRTTTLNTFVKFGVDSDEVDEFQPIPSEKLVKMYNLSSYNRTLPNDDLTLEEHIQHDTVHISRIALVPHIGETPDFTGIQEKELSTFSWTDILKMNSNEWPSLLIGCIAATITGFSLPVYAVLFGECLAVMAVKSSRDFNMKLDFFAQIFLIAGFISGVAMLVQGYMVAVSGSKLTKRLRKNAFTAILKQEMAWFDDEANDVDSLLRMLRIDAVNARPASGLRLTSLTQGVCVMLIISGLSIYYSWRLGLSITFFLPFILMGYVYQNHLVVEHQFHEGIELLKIRLIVEEAVTNIKVIHGLSLHNYFVDQYKTVLLQMHKRLMTTLWIRGLVYGLVVSVSYFAYAACMFYGTYLLKQGEIGYENILKVSEALVLGTIMVGQLLVFGPSMVQAQLSSTRINQLLKRIPRIYKPRIVRENKWKAKGNITYEEVAFEHPTVPYLPVLKDFNLRIKQGQSIALVGSIGAGQSVPTQLLLLLYRTKAGNVELDGHNVEGVDLENLRDNLGLVDGDPIFFHRSIADNIAYGINTRHVKMDEILSAAKQANIHNYIATLPEGYSTVIDMEIMKMTFGQKFRLSLARAVLRDPPVLLIENLQMAEDEDAELLVEIALRQCCMGRTCIMVSNFLKLAVRCANVICVFQKGNLVETGSHNELMDMRGLYYRMYCKQEELHRKTDSQLLINTIVGQAVGINAMNSLQNESLIVC